MQEILHLSNMNSYCIFNPILKASCGIYLMNIFEKKKEITFTNILQIIQFNSNAINGEEHF